MVTSPEDLKALLDKEYTERLRTRPEHPKFKHLFEVKESALGGQNHGSKTK